MLALLKMSDVVRGTTGSDEATRVRAKLVAAIEEQMASVQAAVEKQPFRATRKVGGEVRERRFRPWWFRGAGFYYTTINYGSSPMQLPGGKSIEAGPKLEDLLETYRHAIAAVNAGELDSVALAAAAMRGRKGKGKGPEGDAEAPQEPQGTAAARARRRG
jgi:hypothetical protein